MFWTLVHILYTNILYTSTHSLHRCFLNTCTHSLHQYFVHLYTFSTPIFWALVHSLHTYILCTCTPLLKPSLFLTVLGSKTWTWQGQMTSVQPHYVEGFPYTNILYTCTLLFSLLFFTVLGSNTWTWQGQMTSVQPHYVEGFPGTTPIFCTLVHSFSTDILYLSLHWCFAQLCTLSILISWSPLFLTVLGSKTWT